MGDEKEEEEKVDKRVEFMNVYVLKSMGLKQDKWNKLIENPEMKDVIYGFLNQQYHPRVVFSINASSLLQPTFTFPSKNKNKLCYFIRKKLPSVITETNIRQVLMYGDMLADPLESLSVLLENLYYPILNNPINQVGWTSVLCSDIKIEMQHMRNAIADLKGNMINRTNLPMPIVINELMEIAPDIADGDLSEVTNSVRQCLEEVSLTWSDSVCEFIRYTAKEKIFADDPEPLPSDLFRFWEGRLANLEYIAEQLGDARIRTVAHILEALKSEFLLTFRKMLHNVMRALVEARDITLYLSPLQKELDTFGTLEIDESRDKLRPILMTICLVWGNSKYFCTVEHMILLFRLFHNSLIESCTRTLSPESILQAEIDDGNNKVKMVLEILQFYRESYEECRSRLKTFVTPQAVEPCEWKWDPDLIFHRIELFIERIHELEEIFNVGLDFLRLEKIEITGLKGRYISIEIQAILAEFNNTYREWGNITFNPLDPDPKIKAFPNAKAVFMKHMDVLERKLALQLEKAFQECHEIRLRLQVMQMAGPILDRPVIREQIAYALDRVVQQFAEELDAVKKRLDEFQKQYAATGIDNLRTFVGLPSVAAAMVWLKKLSARVSAPKEEFIYVVYNVFQGEYGEDVKRKYEELMGYFTKLENDIVDKWRSRVVTDINRGMKKYILVETNDRLFINFDKELAWAFTDIRHLSIFGFDIPEEGIDFREKEDELWDTRVKCKRIEEWYNSLYDKTHQTEFDLVKEELEAIRESLDPALTTVTWENYDHSYVDSEHATMKDLYTRVTDTQNNLQEIRKRIRDWGSKPLFMRKELGGKALLDITDRETFVPARYMEIMETRKVVQQYLVKTIKLFFPILGDTEEAEKAIGDEGLEQLILKLAVSDRLLFRAYEAYVDENIADEIKSAIMTSLKYIKTEMENRSERHSPVFEIDMELQVPKIVFFPNIKIPDKWGFYAIVESILDDICKMATVFTRVNQRFDPSTGLRLHGGEELNFEEVERDPMVVSTRDDISLKIKVGIASIKSHVKQFNDFAFFWLEDKDQYLAEVKQYSRPLTHIERTETIAIKEEPATLNVYKKEMDSLMDYYLAVDKWELYEDFNIWLRLNKKSFKYNLLNLISSWIRMFKQDLIDRVINALNDLQDFVAEATLAMARDVDKDDFEGLLIIMTILSKINERQFVYDEMFEPLKETVDLLKQYNYKFSEAVYLQFQELPDAWNKVKKQGAVARQTIAPIQAYQVDLIEKRIILFENRTSNFRIRFAKKPFFQVPCDNVYKLLDKVNEELESYEAQYVHLAEYAQLFEITEPSQGDLIVPRKELRMVKQLWDFVYVIETTVEDWTKTLWSQVDVEFIDMECKRFSRELRTLPKEMRLWNPYLYLEALIKNLMTSLRAITELQNPAMRERHWRELQAVTKVKITMDKTTTLADLLDLQLHRYEEDVKLIVDKSVKEMAMEKVLKDLNSTWTTMEFQTELHDRTQLRILRTSEEMIEILEEHQVQLQNMLGSKFVGFFFDVVNDWQIKLSNADQVISLWTEVQRKWQYLESIFIGSEDIRNQLPEDSKRFENIDREFKALLSQINADKNVVRATSKPDLADKLERLTAQLIMCEKALNDYLEQKRLAYPRFYFVSSADLLDILSNGNKPKLVAKHLTKLYDSMGKLALKDNSKMATGMIAKELEEYVPFIGDCDCSGQVEVWLNRVTDKMRETLTVHLGKAVVAYEDKPRHIWIFDFQAQPTLVTTQIWWTSETTDAFVKLDLGYENAMKDYQKKQINQLNALIILLLGDLTPAERQKIMTVCTIDVHSRDVVAKMILQKVEVVTAFQWQSQLRHRWDDNYGDCFVNICDAQFKYDHEYLGNTPRLVITPLTDRCYITLTQALHLVMGAAPAGPAGTGKTETTKDLGRALGMMVYVFNCSEQMDYRSVGNIHKGLAQTGAWGCFDEFNRISVEVLSVIAVQVKCIQDAIKAKKVIFNFLGEIVSLRPTVGMFITMNPGYAGRAELPENLKALYRPCAMVVPDFALICEIMLVAEGFQEARLLARKFITLYTLCKELLSKQDHYDWGLRAIKSVLVVAGSLRRGDRDRPEDQVLMRALRDFNIPKIVTDDVAVFMGLIGDLFPALDVPRKRDPEFEKTIRLSAVELKLQPEDGFILKVVQLEELLAVRHSVFIIGYAGTGKSEVWKTLFKTYYNQKRKPAYNDLNPKAVTNDELFGVVNPATREWKDGLFSIIMRDQANMSGTGPKWIVLDGDIDPMWIESLNTVMDDNKVLTLASNERIALTKEMRLIFEIYTLRVATPATVSRAGILYINPADLGWSPFITSWIDTRESYSERALLGLLFEKYVPPLLELFKGKVKTIIPISDIARLQMTCYLLNCFLVPANVPSECPRDWYEIYFAFAIIWGFGSTLFQDQIIDWRNEFDKWWKNEFKTVRFPTAGNVFSYYVDQETKKFLPWTNLVPEFHLDPFVPLQSNLVHTGETTRIKYFMDILIEAGQPMMLVGPPGSGKTVLMLQKLASLPMQYAVTKVPFNFYTTSEMLQKILEKPLEKKAGRNYGPPGSKTMVYFVDDMNMPEVDTYGTVQPHTLIRQFMDYRHWYDRVKMSLKDIHKCQFVSCMNPIAGSFTINPRLQRHFCTLALNPPGMEALFVIFNSILSEHMSFPQHKFTQKTQALCDPLVTAAIALHQKVCQTFLPTAVKFHYLFNLRDLANIFTGMLFANAETAPTPDALLRLWVHEASRVYGDKMVDEADMTTFAKVILDVARKGVEGFSEDKVFAQPMIYCHFAKGLNDPKYMPVSDWPSLYKLLAEAQTNYNELVGALNLVLFEDAMSHICRISRIVESSRGNALLIGVGGSGKQSLTRLASFISSLDVFQIQLTKDYSINDMKADIAGLYMKAGVKSTACCFLMTDSEVAKEQFLVVVNDMLASGNIHELFADDEIENIIGALRNEAKQNGIGEAKEEIWEFYIDKVRTNLKIVLCFSPVGATLRVRARKFPALVNGTTIDWFHEWPRQALESVSLQFLSGDEVLQESQAPPIAKFMAFVHKTVNAMSQTYLINDKRYNYTTPKSFLELIALYKKLLKEKFGQNVDRATRLENGLIKLASCSKEVDALQVVLKDQEVILKVKNEEADKLIVVVSAENEKVQTERNFAAEEEKKVRVIEEDATEKAKLCEEDYKAAEPVLAAAKAALDTLNKNNLTELKSFGSPPEAVVNVCAAVIVLFAPKGKIPKDRSWKAAKALMGNVGKFLDDLVNYDKEHIHPEVIKALQPYLANPEFDPEKIAAKSGAAAGLCSWVINIKKFHSVYEVVEPKIRALVDTQNILQAARDKLEALNQRLQELEEKLGVIQGEYNAAMDEKARLQAMADKTAFTIDLAHRLISGLASEKIRWTESIKTLGEGRVTLPGDILLVSCFISYVGCFTKPYRIELLQNQWLPEFKASEPRIPCSEGVDPFEMICDDATIAAWNNEGLPTDRMSAENAAILTLADRYPLMIDPQLQGIRWIKQKYGKDLIVTRQTVRGYMDIIEKAVADGRTLLLENIGESVDAVLNPLLGRMLIKKGKVLKMGDREIDFNPSFRLILHTKLANPHYKPEMQAQTTLINFTVTRDGLEDQLLADVVKVERPDLETMKSKLTAQQNYFKITLKQLEDDLLQRLSNAGDNILEDVTLVMNLEKTKRTSNEIAVKVVEARETSIQIDTARESYRPASERASIVFFILSDLFRVNSMYQFSLAAFKIVFESAIRKAVPAENVKERVINLIDSITYCSYSYTTRALFERDKLIFKFQLATQVLLNSQEIDASELDFLLRFPYTPNLTSPFSFLSHMGWGGIKAMSNSIGALKGLDKDMEGSAKRWQKFTDGDTPEKDKLPGEWKGKAALQRLIIMRALRPDRMTYAITGFIEEKLGVKYAEALRQDFSKTFEETSPYIHVFFILSPGVDPLKDVEKQGKLLGFAFDNENFHSVSLGQGQEIVAETAIDIACKNGHWVILQNIHLVAKWLSALEKKMEATLDNPHEDYRLFLSADPPPSSEYHILPQGILESAIKITNEPPTGMLANVHKALDNFSQETLEMCSKETEFKIILFTLCYFHAVTAERRKFGAQGWNRVYPFNFGDLTISVYVLFNYLEANSRVPWEDLRYLFGEIMYGGHITDDWDRRLCRTYLEVFMQPELLDGDHELCSGFVAPGNLDYVAYHSYIDDNLPDESPHLYGLHLNAEIGFLTTVSERLFLIVFELQPRLASGGGGDDSSPEMVVKNFLDDVLDKIPAAFNIPELMAKCEDKNPYIIVAFQECERMNILMREIKRSLVELELGLKGELTFSSDMEVLMDKIYKDYVPDSWTKLAYPSTLGLMSWFADLIVRLRELEQWVNDFRLPSSVWLGGLFNPQSFLTAIMQQTARKNEWPLDRMCLNCDVTKKGKEDFSGPPREGAYINGLFMEGARWDTILGTIADAYMKDLFPAMPVIYIKAVTQDKQDVKNIYECPVYKIRQRGPTFVWTFNLKTKERASKWTLAGVCLLLQT